MNILVLTDSRSHERINSIFPILRHLSQKPDIENVFVADRAFEENNAFFYDHDPAFKNFSAVKAGPSWTYGEIGNMDRHAVSLDECAGLWLRLDRPVSDDFLTFLQNVHGHRFISNRPDGILKTGTKEFLISLKDHLGDYMPPIQMCRTVEDVLAFREICPDMVLKSVQGYGGYGVVRLLQSGESDLKTEEEIAAFLEKEPALAMKYLNAKEQSDNRLVGIGDYLMGGLKRKAKEGEWRCNLLAGGTAAVCTPDEREVEIFRRVAPFMIDQGIFICGIDTLEDENGKRYLSEINALNVGTIVAFEESSGIPYTKFVADNLALAFRNQSLDFELDLALTRKAA